MECYNTNNYHNYSLESVANAMCQRMYSIQAIECNLYKQLTCIQQIIYIQRQLLITSSALVTAALVVSDLLLLL
jgi:hypothetical protein